MNFSFSARFVFFAFCACGTHEDAQSASPPARDARVDGTTDGQQQEDARAQDGDDGSNDAAQDTSAQDAAQDSGTDATPQDSGNVCVPDPNACPQPPRSDQCGFADAGCGVSAACGTHDGGCPDPAHDGCGAVEAGVCVVCTYVGSPNALDDWCVSWYGWNYPRAFTCTEGNGGNAVSYTHAGCKTGNGWGECCP